MLTKHIKREYLDIPITYKGKKYTGSLILHPLRLPKLIIPLSNDPILPLEIDITYNKTTRYLKGTDAKRHVTI